MCQRMLSISLSILRIITTLSTWGLSGISPVVGVGNLNDNRVHKVSSNYVQTSTALINRQTLAADQSPRHATGCDLYPNFRCASQDFCIPTKLVLNGYNDCVDGSDEDARKVDFCKLGAPFHRCDVNSRCVTTSFGYRCQCLEGFAGDGFYCERFPVGIQIAAAIENTLEDTPVPFNVSVVVFPYGRSSNLSLTITGLPTNAKFDIGSPCNQTAWCFTEEDFSYGTYITANFYPPGDFSGTIPLTIVAELYRDGYWVTGYSATNFEVIAVPDPPVLRVGTVCYMDEENVAVEIPVRARLSDSDGSEELEIDLDGLPEGFEVSTSTHEIGLEVAVGSSEPVVTSLIVKPHKEMVPFNATIIALSREKSNGKENRTDKTVLVAKCPPQPNMNVRFEVPSVNMEDQPIPFHITVKYELEESPRLISIHLLDFPPGAVLSRGHAVNNSSSWLLSRQDLADDGLVLIPPKRFAGEIILNGRSEILYRGFHYMLNSTVVIQISPVVNAPLLQLVPEVICLSINSTNASFVIDASLADFDGSETLMIQYSIPEEWTASVGDSYHGNYNFLAEEDHVVLNITISSPSGFLYPVDIPVVAVAMERDTADQNINFTKVRIIACDTAMLHTLSKPRTTIIWNVTTPVPLKVSPVSVDINATSSDNIPLNLTFTRPGTAGWRAFDIKLPSPTPKSTRTGLPQYGITKAIVDFPFPSASSQIIQMSGLSQADESPRFNRNFSFLTASTTKSPPKVQRLARPVSDATTRRTKPRHRKTKQPQIPGKAKFEDYELEQIVSIGNGSEDIPVRLNISVTTKNAPKHAATETRITGLPVGSWLTKGHPGNGSKAWIIPHRDLGVLFINLPAHLSGTFPLIVSSAVDLQRNKTLIARESVDLIVRPQTDGGEIEINGPFSPKDCIEKAVKEIQLTIRVNLTDNDGSEEVEFLEITGIPKSVFMTPGRFLGNEMAYILFPNEIAGNITLRTESSFPKFRMTIDAKIREKETGIKNSVTKFVTVTPCLTGYHSDADSIIRSFGSMFRMSIVYLTALSVFMSSIK